jgi:hypothetical protein
LKARRNGFQIPHQEGKIKSGRWGGKSTRNDQKKDAEITVMKAQESVGQQKQLFEFNIWTARRNRR